MVGVEILDELLEGADYIGDTGLPDPFSQRFIFPFGGLQDEDKVADLFTFYVPFFASHFFYGSAFVKPLK